MKLKYGVKMWTGFSWFLNTWKPTLHNKQRISSPAKQLQVFSRRTLFIDGTLEPPHTQARTWALVIELWFVPQTKASFLYSLGNNGGAAFGYQWGQEVSRCCVYLCCVWPQLTHAAVSRNVRHLVTFSFRWF